MADHFAADAILRDIVTFTECGDHRTGWPADNAVSDWLVTELAAAGLAAEHAPFAFPCVRPEPSWLALGGKQVAGAPLYDGAFTGPDGVNAPLTDDLAHADGAILVVRNPPVSAHGKGDPWGEARPAGAVFVTGDPEGAVFHRNAERIDAPFAVPVLQVAARDAAPIEAALATGRGARREGALASSQGTRLEGARTVGSDVRLVVRGRREPGTATNVVAVLPATVEPADAPLVVMTPKSGWGPCAAERGGGIAIQLALARHLAALSRRRREVRFLFTSGHELAHYGLTSLIRERPALSGDVALWVHLGASIGAKVPQPSRVFASDETARETLLAAFAAEGARPFESQPPGTMPGGESREVVDRPYVSLASAHAYFHSENDTVEKAVDTESVARFGRAFRRLVEPLVAGR